MTPHSEAAYAEPREALLRACLGADRLISERSQNGLVAYTLKRNPAAVAPMANRREHADAALAFCRKCLGWTSASIVNDLGYSYIKESVPSDGEAR